MKAVNRNIFSIAFSISLIFGVTYALAQSSPDSAQISIMVSQQSDAHNEALTGFLQAIEKYRKIETITYNLNGKMEIAVEAVKWIRRAKPDLVLAVGTTAALAAKDGLKDIPIVLCMVLNPVSSGLVANMKSPGGNITGASLDIPLQTQFKYIKMLVPDLKSIGVLYNPEETGELVKEAEKTAVAMKISLIAKAISSEREVPDALKNVLNNVDVLWSVADGTVFGLQSTQYILLTTLKTGVPFIGLSSAFVKAGALMALSCDYTDIGIQAAETAKRILDGENPKDIPIAVPRKVLLCINLRIAKHIGLNIPTSIIELADEVIR